MEFLSGASVQLMKSRMTTLGDAMFGISQWLNRRLLKSNLPYRRSFADRLVLVAATVIAASAGSIAMAQQSAPGPVPLIFDTDIGNDCDDVLALGMIHALQSRGECQLLAVTITKDHELAAPFVDAVNTFYGRGEIPIGVCRGSNVTPDIGRFNSLARRQDEGQLRYPHDLSSGNDAPDAVSVLREVLANSQDNSVVIAQVGFSTNLASLLRSGSDDFSQLSGVELVAKKVRLLSIMAGAFRKVPNERGELYEHREYNVVQDIPSAKRLVADWPTEIVWSGFEIGLALPYPHQSILRDYNYVPHHPLKDAYIEYVPPPHNRPTWDLTSVLVAVRPDHDYFQLSDPGRVAVADDGLTTWHSDGQRDRYLILREGDHARVLEALTLLSSQPPSCPQ
jgi:purine nucleosidase